MSIPAVNVNAATPGNIAIEKSVVALVSAKGAFLDDLIDSWRKVANDGAAFTVNISGVNDFAAVKAVKAALTVAAPNYEQRGFNKPILELEITRTGKAEDLAEALDGLKVGKQKLIVENIQGNILTVELK